MRVSTLTSLALATAVSAASKATYLKSSETDGDYWLGWVGVEDSNTIMMCFYNEFQNANQSQPSAQAFHINDDATLDVGDGGFGLILPPLGPSDLSFFAIDYEHPDQRPAAATGFSWAENGTLLFDNSDFHGWVHCKGGNWTGSGGDDSFYWATKPNQQLLDGCKQVDLVKDLR